MNKELRQLNPKSYSCIQGYACATLYSLYKYYQEKKEVGKVEKILYRALNMKFADILLYKVCNGDIICYPGFTSACISAITPDKLADYDIPEEVEAEPLQNKKSAKQYLKDLLFAKKIQDEDERLPSPLGKEIAYEDEDTVDCVDIIIENNAENINFPAVINISELSDKKGEEERLFPAFSFFKIKDVKILEGTKEEPHQIFLEVVQKKFNLEVGIHKGERVYLDSQTNLLMTRKIINE